MAQLSLVTNAMRIQRLVGLGALKIHMPCLDALLGSNGWSPESSTLRSFPLSTGMVGWLVVGAV